VVPFHFPIFKILLGLFVIYLGVKIIAGDSKCFSFRCCKNGKTIFANARVNFSDVEDKSGVVFGSKVYDFTNATIDSVNGKTIKIDVAFGGAKILLPKDVPTKVKYNVAFGEVELPDETAMNFGSGTYTNALYEPGKPHLLIRMEVAFAEAEVE
jgi:predicted membrane protein